MSKRRLLCSMQEFEYTPKHLNEAMSYDSSAADGIILEGIIQKADTLNQNGRVYPKEILQREVANYQKLIIENRATGECDHPESSVISLERVSHKFLKVWMEDKIVYGRIKLLNTPLGKLLQTLVADNVKLGISSRGVGSTEKKGDYHIVQDDFQIICWDMVSEPSTPGAFMLPKDSPYLPEGRVISNIEDALYESNCQRPKSRIDCLLDDLLLKV